MLEMKSEWFSDIEEIVSEDLRFKAALSIGEDAYTSLKLKNAALGLWDVFGVATTGAQIASSTVVASHFFSAGGVLGLLGIGTAATPVGWIITASVLAGGSWFGITRYFKTGSDKVTVIPKFINTPLDILALSLFDLMAPISMKIAAIDGHISDEEIKTIRNFFIKTWGYSTEFTDQGLAFIQNDIESFTINDIATALASFARENPDCNFEEMTQTILSHLKEIATVDGKIDEREVMAIEKIEDAFRHEAPLSIPRHLTTIKSSLSKAGETVRDASSSASETASESIADLGGSAAKATSSALTAIGSTLTSARRAIKEIK
jgi:uncharacterized tellurite resistance protein B-like protein